MGRKKKEETEAVEAKAPAMLREKRVRVTIEDLPCTLTSAEHIARAKDLAQCETDLRNEAEHAETVKKGLKQREGLLLVKRSQLADVVRTGKEPRPIRVEGWVRYDEGIYEEVRTDTGEVIPGSRRHLSESERQVSVFDGDGEALEDGDEPAGNLGDKLESPLTEGEEKALARDVADASRTSARKLTPIQDETA